MAINGTRKNDILNGTLAADLIRGDDGNDHLFGFAGDDELFGDGGNDDLFGGLGRDGSVGGDGLTERQAEVLHWVALGKTNEEVAQIMQLSPATVKKHLEHIYAKLEVSNRTAAARHAGLARASWRP